MASIVTMSTKPCIRMVFVRGEFGVLLEKKSQVCDGPQGAFLLLNENAATGPDLHCDSGREMQMYCAVGHRLQGQRHREFASESAPESASVVLSPRLWLAGQ